MRKKAVCLAGRFRFACALAEFRSMIYLLYCSCFGRPLSFVALFAPLREALARACLQGLSGAADPCAPKLRRIRVAIFVRIVRMHRFFPMRSVVPELWGNMDEIYPTGYSFTRKDLHELGLQVQTRAPEALGRGAHGRRGLRHRSESGRRAGCSDQRDRERRRGARGYGGRRQHLPWSGWFSAGHGIVRMQTTSVCSLPA